MKNRKGFTLRERQKLKAVILEKTGYYIRGNCLLEQIFTRSSYSAEQGGENNEILEFIGDQVLSYYIVKVVAERYGGLNSNAEYKFRIRENRFTEIKQAFVNNETLAQIIDEWGLAEYLIVGKSDFANQVDHQLKPKADLFEAILGAIAVASKWDAEVLEKAVEKMLSFDERVKEITQTESHPAKINMDNAVNTLKELAEHGGCTHPIYEYGTPEQQGYDEDGNPKWCCTCTVITDKTGIRRQVWSSSKKAAKKAAAYLILCDHFELQNEYGTNGKFSCWVYKDGKLMPEHLMKENRNG
jgi:ribonuclease-3